MMIASATGSPTVMRAESVMEGTSWCDRRARRTDARGLRCPMVTEE